MQTLISLFGSGKNMELYQTCLRAAVIFVMILLLILISGRRSFGMKTPLDNIIALLLGALISRAVVGASPFVSVIAASLVLVILHRLFAWITMRHKAFSKLIDGEKLCLYKGNRFLKENMGKALICEEAIRQGIRESALTADLAKIDSVFMERNRKISVVKTEQ